MPAAFMKIEIKDTATTTISSTFAGSLKEDIIRYIVLLGNESPSKGSVLDNNTIYKFLPE